MPAAHPPEFRRRALDLVAQGDPVGQTARDLGISESCLRNWMSRDQIDAGRKPALTTEERKAMYSFPVPGPNFGVGVSQQSVHPNTLGTTYYAAALQDALNGFYP